MPKRTADHTDMLEFHMHAPKYIFGLRGSRIRIPVQEEKVRIGMAGLFSPRDTS
jgi:hypothetical protein